MKHGASTLGSLLSLACLPVPLWFDYSAKNRLDLIQSFQSRIFVHSPQRYRQ